MEFTQINIFRIGDEYFGVDIRPIQEIIRMPEVVRVPLAPKSLLGLANLRGKVLPIVSLRRIFGLPDIEEGESLRAIVVNIGETLGFLVDQVASVVMINQEEVEPADGVSKIVKSEYLDGLVRKAGNYEMVMLLNLKKIIEKEFSGMSFSERKEYITGGESEDEKEKKELEETQLVCFQIEDQEYGIPISYVNEIVQFPDKVIQIPNSPHYVKGVMHLRDRFLPLISLRRFFGLESDVDQGRVVVLSKDGLRIGIHVDQVNEVLRIPKSSIESLPELMERNEISNITGICTLDNGKRLVSILSGDEFFKLVSSKVKEEIEKMETRRQEEFEGKIEDEEVHMVVFKLQDEEYAVSIDYVQEIVRLPEEIVHVPKAPESVKGVINLRGTVLPIIDLRQQLGFPPIEKNERQRIIVFLINGIKTGFIVDSVTEVMRLSRSLIEEAPVLSKEQKDVVGKVINLNEQRRLIQVINPERLLSKEELKEIKEIEEKVEGNER